MPSPNWNNSTPPKTSLSNPITSFIKSDNVFFILFLFLGAFCFPFLFPILCLVLSCQNLAFNFSDPETIKLKVADESITDDGKLLIVCMNNGLKYKHSKF